MTHSRFASRLATLLAGLALLVAPGCMKGSQTMVVGKDGAGTATMKIVVDQGKMNEIMEMIKGMMGGGDEMGGGDPPMKKEFEEKMNLDEIKKKLEGKKGVELVSATPIDDAEKKLKGFEVKVKFDSIENYFRAGVAENVDVELVDLGGGSWKITHKTIMGGPGGESSGEEDAAQMEMVKGMFEPFMGEFEMLLTVTVPGQVTDTNGTKDAAGSTVTWKMGFEDMLDSKKRTQTITFKAEGATLKPFHLRVGDDGKVEDVPAKPAEPAAPAPVK